MFVTRNFNVTPKTTEQHSIVRIDKICSYLTNSKTLRSTFCILLKLTTDRHEASRMIARPLCDSRVTCGWVHVTCIVNNFVIKLRNIITSI